MRPGDGDITCIICGQNLYGAGSSYKDHKCDERLIEKIECARKASTEHRAPREMKYGERLELSEFLNNILEK